MSIENVPSPIVPSNSYGSYGWGGGRWGCAPIWTEAQLNELRTLPRRLLSSDEIQALESARTLSTNVPVHPFDAAPDDEPEFAGASNTTATVRADDCVSIDDLDEPIVEDALIDTLAGFNWLDEREIADDGPVDWSEGAKLTVSLGGTLGMSGLSKSQNKCMNVLIYNVMHGSKPSYSRSKGFYSYYKHFRPPWFTHHTVTLCVDWLVENGWCTTTIEDSVPFNRQQSTYQATEKLLSFDFGIDRTAGHAELHQLSFIKDADKNHIDMSTHRDRLSRPELKQFKHREAQLERINRAWGKTRVFIEGMDMNPGVGDREIAVRNLYPNPSHVNWFHLNAGVVRDAG